MVHAAVAVAVGDKNVAVAAYGYAGRQVEWSARLLHEGTGDLARVRRHIARAQREYQVSFGIPLLDDVRVPVSQVNVSSFAHADAVCFLVLQVPRVKIVALAVEDDHVVRTPVIDIHIVVAVHRYVRDLLELEPFGQLPPAIRHFVHVIATSECHIADLPNQCIGACCEGLADQARSHALSAYKFGVNIRL